jgi:anti-anti-sigma factor
MEPTPSVVAVVGELDLSTMERWDADVRAAARDSSAVILDLSQVHFVDSAGVRTLFRWALTAEQRDIRMVVVAPHDGPLWRLLDILDLESVAPICDSREAAVEACKGPARRTRATSQRAA